MVEKVTQKLLDSSLTPAVITSDNDGKAADVCSAVLSQASKPVPLKQADPCHLGQSLYRNTLKADFSCRMFLVCTKKDREPLQRLLGRDLMALTSCVAKRIRPNMPSAQYLSNLVSVLVDCLCGNHDRCRLRNPLCTGKQNGSWMVRRGNLFKCHTELSKLNADTHDRYLLCELIRIVLDPKAMAMTKCGFSTQNNESFNRVISCVLPKNITFPATASSRLASAVHRHNNGRANSRIILLERAGAPLTRGSYAITRLSAMQLKSDKIKRHGKSIRAKVARQKTARRKLSEWLARKQTVKSKAYEKGQCDPYKANLLKRSGAKNTQLAHLPSTSKEHSYV